MLKVSLVILESLGRGLGFILFVFLFGNKKFLKLMLFLFLV